MISPGQAPDQEHQCHKHKQIDYAKIANQLAISSQVDPLLQICRNESLDSYAHLQSLMGMLYCFLLFVGHIMMTGTL